MDFLSNLSKKDESKHNPNDATAEPDQIKPTKSDLIHSAKVMADVAQAHLRHEPNKYNEAEVANATADLLNSAAEYGKLDEKGIGKYVDKAEGYLRHYHSSGEHDAAGGGGGKTEGDFANK
ncbi:nodulin-related protein 1 [Striga hermonthica]|uniref:Nodulin-related protein 1 n=1 Tax=Striga hermonthica TaxID=68872 RepID=A0A9N7RA42_STRHE|nr:nodulin-related protein 1 [Striga hermonthica]